MELPSVGTRLNLHGNIGTVRFVGPVDNTTGVWLGVEWDNPERGKHDGIKDNKRYFTCRIPNAGSFIRPSANVTYGQTFVDAMTSKYIEEPHGSGSPEKVVLGSSDGAIEVEAVDLDKVRRKLAALERLREVSLDNESVAKADLPGTVSRTCPSIRGLDLSFNLFPTWEVIAQITAELPQLDRLALNRNRLQVPPDLSPFKCAFLRLTELQLNGTMTTWGELGQLMCVMPQLRLAEMGYNRISHLTSPMTHQVSTIETVNLDSNLCQNWIDVCQSLKNYNCLQRVLLASNGINTIPFPSSQQVPWDSLHYLSLSANHLAAWGDIDALAAWCPNLHGLALNGNPMVMGIEGTKFSRPFTIAKIPSLVMLDGAKISGSERLDSELFYISYIANNGPATEEQRVQEHPQWSRLCQKHGRPSGHFRQGKLSQQQIRIKLTHHQPEGNAEPPNADVVLEPLLVLQKMTLRTLRMKLCKVLKRSYKDTDVQLWVVMDDGSITLLGHEDDSKELGWFGVEDSTELLFQTRRK
ncbi:hypothetical protein BDN72DRAFT_830912 [Pluteus cervinus]|uniref:Uncharacterized protein n=1 Tax=Pluteus cervinus TaxID=181527 RepID=A0ACD3BF34_9AGAR|nr:hypothetical protein BDN72DRAFT_830912 [Pluteus cervinus]